MSQAPALTIVHHLVDNGYGPWFGAFWSNNTRSTFADETKTIAGKVSDSQAISILSDVDLDAFQACKCSWLSVVFSIGSNISFSQSARAKRTSTSTRTSTPLLQTSTSPPRWMLTRLPTCLRSPRSWTWRRACTTSGTLLSWRTGPTALLT